MLLVSVYSVVTSVQAEEKSDIVVSVNSIFSVVIFVLSVDVFSSVSRGSFCVDGSDVWILKPTMIFLEY